MRIPSVCLKSLAFTGLLLSGSPAAEPAAATLTVAPPPVEGWFFRAISGYPAAIDFEPVVLFQGGVYCEVGDESIERLNVAQAKSKQPTAWGTWQKTGSTFRLTDSKHKTHDYQLGSGNWFPAFAYTGAVKLKPAYEKTSGGDYGAGTSALAISRINFIDATHFTQGLNAGISMTNAVAGKKTSSAGTYKLQGHTLELTYTTGQVVKKSFALGATGTPARATNTLVFIGGDAYTDAD